MKNDKNRNRNNVKKSNKNSNETFCNVWFLIVPKNRVCICGEIHK